MNATIACKSSCKAVAVLCLIKIVTILVNYRILPCIETITLILLAIFNLLEILLILIHLVLVDSLDQKLDLDEASA